jgi:hypothetical protein
MTLASQTLLVGSPLDQTCQTSLLVAPFPRKFVTRPFSDSQKLNGILFVLRVFLSAHLGQYRPNIFHYYGDKLLKVISAFKSRIVIQSR